MRRTYTRDAVDQLLEDAKEAAPRSKVVGITLREVVTEGADVFNDMLEKRGFTYGALSEWLEGHGVTISASVLRQYLRKANANRQASEARARRSRNGRKRKPSAAVQESQSSATGAAKEGSEQGSHRELQPVNEETDGGARTGGAEFARRPRYRE